MSRITELIPEQNFEIVRDVIGAIILDELSNQKVMQPNRFSEDLKVFTARSTPFQQSEKLMINVSCDNGNYTSRSQKGNHGGINYNVDIFARGYENASENGGLNASKLRDKYIGAIRYILSDTHYVTLGLPLGLIMGTSIESFENYEVPNSVDSAFVQMGRLVFNVRMTENQSLWDGVLVNSLFTNVRIDLTDKGYQLIKEF